MIECQDTKEEKIRICKKVINDGKSSCEVAKEENITSSGMIRRWVKAYIEDPNLLENKKKLTEIEKLEYENMRLRIENERLKKGYLIKGDGSVVTFKK